MLLSVGGYYSDFNIFVDRLDRQMNANCCLPLLCACKHEVPIHISKCQARM